MKPTGTENVKRGAAVTPLLTKIVPTLTLHVWMVGPLSLSEEKKVKLNICQHLLGETIPLVSKLQIMCRVGPYQRE